MVLGLGLGLGLGQGCGWGHLGRRACVTEDHVQRAAVGLHGARGQQQCTDRQAQREGQS